MKVKMFREKDPSGGNSLNANVPDDQVLVWESMGWKVIGKTYETQKSGNQNANQNQHKKNK